MIQKFNWIGGLILAFTAISLFGGFSQPWDQTKVLIILFSSLLLLVGCVSYMIFFTQVIRLRVHFLHVLVILGVIFILLSIIFSRDIQYSFFGPVASFSDGGVLVIMLLLSIFIIPQFGKPVYRYLFRGLEIGITLAGFYTGLLLLLPIGEDTLIRIWSIFGFQNFPSVLITPSIATALIIHSIIAVGFLGQFIMEYVQKKKRKMFLGYTALGFTINYLLLIFFVGDSVSAIPYILFIIGASLFILILSQKRLLLEDNRITKVAFVMYFFVSLTVVLTIFSPVSTVVQNQFEFISRFTRPVAISSVQESPLIGFGPGNISFAWNKFYPRSYNYTPNWEQQQFSLASEYLDILVQYGFIGLALGLIGVTGVLYFGYITVIKDKLNFDPIYYVSLIGLLLFSVLGIFSSLNLMMILLGCVMIIVFIGEHFQAKIFTLSHIQVSTKSLSPTVVSFISFLGIFVYIGVALLGFIFGRVLQSDLLLQQAVRASDEEEVSDRAFEALEIYPSNLPAAQVYTRIQLQKINEIIGEEFQKEQPDNDRIESEVSRLLEVVNQQQESHPNDFASLDLIATSYTTLQQQVGIDESQFEEIIKSLGELAPNDPRVDIYEANFNIVRYRIAVQQTSEDPNEINPQTYLDAAKEALDRAIEKKDDYAISYLTYETVFQLEENPQGAVDILEDYLIAVASRGSQIDTDLITVLAQTYIQVGRLDDAERFADQLLASSPEAAVLYYLRGQIDEEKNLPSQALEWYVRGLEFAPESEVLVERVEALGGTVPSE